MRSNISWKSQKRPLSDKHFLKKPITTFSHQTPTLFQASFSNFLKGTHKPNYSFFTFSSLPKDYVYQQRFNSTSKLNPTEWQTILKKLQNNDASLSALELRAMFLGDAEAKELATALKENYTLTKLNLEGNRISDIGAKSLAEVLKKNCTLSKLDLMTNEIGDEGAKALASIFKANRTLISVDLSFNQITDEGVQVLKIALQENRTLTWFGLWGCGELVVYSSRGNIPDMCSGDHVADDIIQYNCTLRDEMHEAVRKGETCIVNKYLQQGVSLLAVSGEEDNTALHWAITAKQPQMVAHLLDLMLQQKIPLDNKNKDNKTAGDLAKGTELETLFTSIRSTFSTNDKKSVEINSWETEYPLKNKF